MHAAFPGSSHSVLGCLLLAAGTLLAPELRAQPAGCVNPPPGIVGWWQGETNASDIIGGNAGGLQLGVSFAPGEVGGCFDFIGNSLSYIEVPDAPSLRLTNEVTIEFWVKRQRLTFPSFPYADYVVEKGGDFTGHQTDYAAALHNSTYNYCLHFVFAGGWRGGGSIAETNLWHHCAIVARQGDVNPILYIDGVNQPVVYSEGDSTINLYPSTRPLHIGAMIDPVTGWQYYSDILVDELSIYNRALAASEIQAIYASGAAGKCAPYSPAGCVPAPTNILSWWRAEGDGKDSIGTNDARLSGGVTFTNGMVGQGFLFNGVDGAVIADDSPSLNVGSNQNFSIEAWISPLNSATDYGIMSIVDKRYAPTLTQCLGYEFNLQDGRVHCRLSDSITGNGSDFGPAGPDLRDGNFHHVALAVYRASTTGGSLYVDGQEVLNFNPTTAFGDLSNAQPFRIGNHASSFVNAFFKGRLDEVAFYNRALGSNEVYAIYAAGSAGKCPLGQGPSLLSQPVDQTVNAGGAVAFNVSAAGAPPLAYQWFFNTQPLGGATSASLVLSNVQPSQAGDYSVGVTNAFGSATSALAHLTVLTNPPTITIQPQDRTVNAGSTAFFSVAVEGTPPFAYQWFFSNTLLAGAAGPFLQLSNVAPDQAGTYWVLVSNAWGSAISSNAALIVLAFPPSIVTQPHDTVAFVGGDLVLQVSATGSPVLSYQWQKDESPIPGATRAQYRSVNAQLTNSGVYSVVVTNPYGSVTSSNAVVTVRVPPPCAPPPPGLVSWWRGETNALDGWDGNNAYPLTQTLVKYAAGKVGQAFAYSAVQVPDSLSLRVSNITLQAWVKATNYAGTLPRTIVSKFDYEFGSYPSSRQNSFYLGTTNNGRVYFGVSPNGTNVVAVTTALPLAADEWSFVVATYDGAALRIYTNGLLAATKAYSSGIFPGSDYVGIGAIAIPLGTGYASYQPFTGLIDEVCLYNRALSDSEIMSLYDADVSGMCLEPPVITAQPQSQTVPLGEDVLFAASVEGSRPLRYQWYFNNQPLFRATNATLLLEHVSTNQAGLYSVRMTNSLGFALSDAAQLTLSPAPVCVEPPPGLLSWWPADRSPIDVVGTNNVMSVPLTLYTTGKVGSAFAIPSQRFVYPFSSGLTVPNSPTLNFKSNADFTIETWVKNLASAAVFYPPIVPPSPPSTTSEVVSKHGLRLFPTVVDTGYAVLLDQGRLGFWLSAVNGRVTNSATFTSSGPDLRDGMFHHVAVTFARNATNGGTLYVDGTNVLTFNTVPFRGDISNTGPLSIGNDGVFNGVIDELTFYSRALSAEEILSIRQAGAAGKCKERPFIISQPAIQIVPPGGDATFTVTAGGTPNLRYQWRFNNSVVSGATRSSLTLSNVQSSSVGDYFVTITNGFGSVTSTNARLTLNRAPVALCAPVVVAAGLNCTADASVNSGSFDPDGNLHALIQTPPGPYPLGTNVVTLTALDSAGASNSCASFVIVLDQTPPTITCPGNTTVTNAHNAWTSIVTFNPAVTDNCSGVGSAICNPASGSAFPIGTTVVNCAAVDASGNSNSCTFKVTVLPGNVPPVPIIRVSPLTAFWWLTNAFVIAGNGTNASVVFDGSRSYDVDDAHFYFAWYLGDALFSSNRVAHRVLAIGDYTVTLRLDDTFPLGTNSTSVAVKVISAADALQLIRQKVEASSLPRSVKRVLLDTLDKARRELQRGQLHPAGEAVRQFQHEVQRLVPQFDRTLADALNQAAQGLRNALLLLHGRYGGTPPAVSHLGNGVIQLRFSGEAGQVHVIEASSDLVNWQEIGVAAGAANGSFEFEDREAGALSHRYYRIVVR